MTLSGIRIPQGNYLLEQGIPSPKLLQGTMHLEKLRSKDSSLKSSIVFREALFL